MASLYEIKKELLETVDIETGEVIDTAKFDELQIELNEKIENIALWHKNLLSEAAAFKAEKDAFAEREKQAKTKAESLKNYLDSALNGKKFSTVKVDISYRKSKSLFYDGQAKIPEQYLKQVEPTLDKVAVTNDIKAGKEIKGFEIKENNNIQIK